MGYEIALLTTLFGDGDEGSYWEGVGPGFGWLLLLCSAMRYVFRVLGTERTDRQERKRIFHDDSHVARFHQNQRTQTPNESLTP